MYKLSVCLILVLGLSLAPGSGEVIDGADDDVIRSEMNMTLDDGQNVMETSAADKECHMQLMTAQFEDNTNNTLVNDLDGDKGLVLFSDTPEVCYVRSLDGKKENCSGGYEVTETDDSGSERVIHYTDGEELNITDLPNTLQELCENRTVIQLVEAADPTGENDTAEVENVPQDEEAGDHALREKRWVRWVWDCGYRKVKVCTITKTCKYCCKGWFFRRRRCGSNCCTTYVRCRVTVKYACGWRVVFG